MDLVKGIGAFLLVVFVLLGLTWVVQGNDFFMYKMFAPRYEAVRRETVEQSHAYRQGMVQNLENLQAQYILATPVQRGGLATIILQRAGDIPDQETLPLHTRQFLDCVRRSAPAYEQSCQAT